MSSDAEEIKPVEYSVRNLWCAAVAADRQNLGYVKERGYGDDSPTPNRTLVRVMLLENSGWGYGDMQIAQEYHQYWKDQLLLLLDDTASGYHRAIAHVSSSETISESDGHSIAVIASAVSATRDLFRRKKVNKLKMACNHSYAGEIGEKIETQVRIIDCRWVEKVGAYSIEAVTVDNFLTQWWKDEPVIVNESYHVQARVKRRSIDYSTGVPATCLNYTRYWKVAQ